MLVAGKKPEHPLARFLVSTALIVVSLGYGYWQNFASGPRSASITDARPNPAPPKLASLPARAAAQVAVEAARPSVSAIGTPSVTDSKAPQRPTAAPHQATATPPSPAASQAIAIQQPLSAAPAESPMPVPAVNMPAGTHLEDGEYIGQHEDFEWGTVQVKVLVRAGAITDVQFLQSPDHRERSAELSDLARPILIREAIRDQKSKVDIVSSATYTSMAYQDSLADALMKATR
jgi:uncharacterized protein with FMN-binding domain